ncbi:MAG: Fpg/Nei family DNA glycosylase [Anaerolineales bacterium]|nr:Fpg/Nei family DNA glycosylase [Anaerolineales bacterium]
MPELPELEVAQEVLNRRLLGQTITAADAIPPGAAIVLRDLTGLGFSPALTGATFQAIVRRGKFLVFTLAQGGALLWLVINPKLTGRLQLCAPKDKKAGPIHAVLHLSDGQDLRYVDQKKMGQVFLTRQPPESAPIADFASLGPDALAVSREDFKARLKKYQGEIKGVLTRGECVAGIGNAYPDEVLWWAKLHPYRKRASLTPEEIDRLYDKMQACLLDAIDKVRTEMGEDIHLKPRDFLAIHMKAGAPCPRCGTAISLVGANQRITNFCRTCQPGGLIKGM